MDDTLTANPSQGVYIYQPSKHGKPSGERPPKRRKVGLADTRKQNFDTQTFVPLLNGEESSESVQLRQIAYRQLWLEQERKIQV